MTLLNTLPDTYGVRSPILGEFSTSPAPLGAPRSVRPTVSGWFLFPASWSLYPTYTQIELSQRLTGVPVEISRVLPLWNRLFARLHPASSWHSGFLAHHYLSVWLGLVRVTRVCAAGWKLPRGSRLGQLEGSTLLFPVFQNSRTGWLALVQDLKIIISYILCNFLFVYGEKATPVEVDHS